MIHKDFNGKIEDVFDDNNIYNGYIAHVAIFDKRLTDAQLYRIACGKSPTVFETLRYKILRLFSIFKRKKNISEIKDGTIIYWKL